MDGECNNNHADWRSAVSNSLTKDIDNLPAPTQERQLDSNIITADERYFHPNLFGKKDDKKYLRVSIVIVSFNVFLKFFLLTFTDMYYFI